MSRIRIVGGKLTKITCKDHFIYSRGNIKNTASKRVVQIGQENGVIYGIPNIPNLEYEEAIDYQLQSSFAHEHLMKTAKELSEMAFIMLMLQIFGEDIEIEAFGKLYRDLCDEKVEPPKILVTQNPIKNYRANYSNKRKNILVSKGFLKEAISDNEARAQLMVALLEEYGHHIDNLLRTDYATNGKEDKDIIDEGAKFAYYFLTVDFTEVQQLEFAEVKTPEYSGVLILDLSKENGDLSRYVDEPQQYDDDPNEDDIENFGFGFEAGTHGGIEMKVLNNDELFSYSEVLQIYYGNWLRDVSQVLVPFTIRFTKAVREKIENHNATTQGRIQHIKATNTTKISLQGWVELIELFAAKEFIYHKGQGVKTQNYLPHIRNFRQTYGQLTKDILGVYRPEEHIDNPRGLTKEADEVYQETRIKREIPGGYEDISFYIGEAPDCFRINQFGQKYYIYRDTEDAQAKLGIKEVIKPDPLRPSSDTYLSNQLKLAVIKGKNRDGFRHFGAALHVLEDYFSHTNFVELSLCKLGWKENSPFPNLKRVYPWVEGRQGTDYSTIPIVTGKFLLDDTCASVIPKMGDLLFPVGFTDYQVMKPGERTFAQQAVYTLLADLAKGQKEDPTQNQETYLGMDSVELFDLYKNCLEFLDKYRALQNNEGIMGWGLRAIGRIAEYMADIITSFSNIAFNLLIESVDDDIKEAQTHITNKHYGEDPTHTQLGKDAHEHPLNGLAAELAKIAVADVGQRMKDIWEGKTYDPDGSTIATYVLNTYSRHPKNAVWMEQKIEEWAENNKTKLEKLYHPTVVGHTHSVVKRGIGIGLEKIEEIKKYFNK